LKYFSSAAILSILVPERYRPYLSAIYEKGFVAVGSIFLITPYLVTIAGVAYVALLVPAYHSVSAINKTRVDDAQRRRERAESERKEEEDALKSRLRYWIVAMPLLLAFFLLEGVGVDRLIMWYHIKLGVFMAMQLFGGVEWLYAFVGSLASYVTWWKREQAAGGGGPPRPLSQSSPPTAPSGNRGDERPFPAPSPSPASSSVSKEPVSKPSSSSFSKESGVVVDHPTNKYSPFRELHQRNAGKAKEAIEGDKENCENLLASQSEITGEGGEGKSKEKED
jgi:hypothetical protein